MKKYLVLTVMLFTIFLDMFNLGLIYPVFTSLVFEGNGNLIPPQTSEFYKNIVFGLLISSFPFGQFLGAPIIGQLSDYYGRRRLLILSSIGTVITLLLCSVGVFYSMLSILFLGRFLGGLMAGNMTLAYAALADFSSEEEKIKNFALIPLVTGIGFALGPYLAGILANPESGLVAGPALPFLLAVLLSFVNLCLIFWMFPETLSQQTNPKKVKGYFVNMNNLVGAFRKSSFRPYLVILFFMISANLLFVQFVGTFAIDRFHFGITEVGYLYANIGVALALGHLFLTRTLSGRFALENVLLFSLMFLTLFLECLLFSNTLILLHVFSFLIMLACAVAYTNAMALVSNSAAKEKQGETMGIAVSVQCLSEFFPALVISLVASFSQAIPLITATVLSVLACLVLIPKLLEKSEFGYK